MRLDRHTQLPNNCVLFRSCFLFLFFRVFLYHYRFHLDGEYAVRIFLPDVFFYLVTTGCIFNISLCENSIHNQSLRMTAQSGSVILGTILDLFIKLQINRAILPCHSMSLTLICPRGVSMILVTVVCLCVCIQLHITAQSSPIIYSFYASGSNPPGDYFS